MKNHSFLLCAVSLLLVLFASGCENSSDNNKGLEFDELSVNFKGKLINTAWPDDSTIGIFSSCTGIDGETRYSMSINENAKYKPLDDEAIVNMRYVSDADDIIAYAGDHNFMFCSYFPYNESIKDIHNIPVGVKAIQTYIPGILSSDFYVSKRNATGVVAPIEFEYKNIFSSFSLQIGNDIFGVDVASPILKKMCVRPVIAENFNGEMALCGSYNLETEVFTVDESTRAQEIIIEFGEDGLLLNDVFTSILIGVTPLTIPEGGFEVVCTDINDSESTVVILSEDGGKKIEAGDIISQRLTVQEEDIISVIFPVTFPVGYPNDVAVSNGNNDIAPTWKNNGIYYSPSQPQAYMYFNKVSEKCYTEWVNNATYKLSTPGLKSVWTGDGVGFMLPVKNFTAGTTVKITFPLYSRGSAAFWNIEYLDGKEWKSNKQTLTYANTGVSMDATFCFISDALAIHTHSMTFENAINKGNVQIRITCADGSWRGKSATTIAQDNGIVDGTPWYFGRNNIMTEIKIEIEK